MRWIRNLTTNKNKDNITENQEDISLQSTTLPKQNDLIDILSHLIKENADNSNIDLEKYIESYQFLKEKKCSPMCFIIAGDTSSTMSYHDAEKE